MKVSPPPVHSRVCAARRGRASGARARRPHAALSPWPATCRRGCAARRRHPCKITTRRSPLPAARVPAPVEEFAGRARPALGMVNSIYGTSSARAAPGAARTPPTFPPRRCADAETGRFSWTADGAALRAWGPLGAAIPGAPPPTRGGTCPDSVFADHPYLWRMVSACY